MEVRSIRCHRVVAFDSDGAPLKVPLSKWKADFDAKSESINLRYKSTRLTYRLRGDLETVTTASESQEFALGRTVGRIALSALAGRLLGQGKGLGAAFVDLSIRGAERRNLVELLLVFADTTTVSVVVPGQDLAELKSMLPGWFFSNKARARMDKFAGLVERMARDGIRVLNELQEHISALKEEINSCRKTAEEGESFAVRDSARERITKLEYEVANAETLAKVVRWELNQPGYSSSGVRVQDKGLISRVGGLAFFLICIVSFFVVGFIGSVFAVIFADVIGLKSEEAGGMIVSAWLGAFAVWLWWALRKRRRSRGT